jgi:alpha/beta superfamily hydrolase
VSFEAEFFYRAQPRLQLCFDSPNHCATVLGMLAVLLAGVLVSVRSAGGSRLSRFLLPVTAIALLSSLLGLALTYSRGGWLAFGCGMLLLALSGAGVRKLAILVFGVFLLLLLLVPKGAGRISSYADTEDRSILHRLMVWEGALAMSAEHWQCGVGEGQFGKNFSAWYQPLAMKTRYSAALNNYLTTAAERGIPVLWVYLLSIFCPLLAAWRLAWKRQQVLPLSVLAALAVFLVSGLFTYSLTFRQVTVFYWGLYALAVIWLIVQWWKSKDERHVIRAGGLQGAALAGVLALAVWFSGLVLLQKIPVVAHPLLCGEMRGWLVAPRHGNVRALWVYFYEKGDSAFEQGKQTLRPLAEKGVAVVCVDYRAGGRDGLADAREVMEWALAREEWKQLPVAVIGHGFGGRVAILANCGRIDRRVKGVVSIGAAAEWPFSDLAPVEHLAELQVPLLVIHGREDMTVNPGQALLLYRGRGKAVYLSLYDAGHYFDDDQWSSVLDEAGHFFDIIAAD